MTDTPTAIIARSNNRPLDPALSIFEQSGADEAIVELKVQRYSSDIGLSPDIRLAEQALVLAQFVGNPPDRITVTTFGDRQAASYQPDFGQVVVITPLDSEHYLRADVAVDSTLYTEFYQVPPQSLLL